MKIAILFASNRRGGKHEEIRKMISSLNLPYEYDFIELADYDISHCRQNCPDCEIKTQYRCLCDSDTEIIMKKLIDADVNLIIVPLYFPYPSKFVALMEKLLNACYRIENRPLKNKPTALFLYCSVKIADETQLKIHWQQYLMDTGYSFTEVNYPYLNELYHDALNDKYNKDITAYIKDFMINMKNKMIDSRCGLHCTGCEYKETCSCGGCIETNGRPFHGECPVAVCCQKKGIVHCGECPDIPCELLTQYSCDPEHGDTPQGARIEQCKRWYAESKGKN